MVQEGVGQNPLLQAANPTKPSTVGLTRRTPSRQPDPRPRAINPNAKLLRNLVNKFMEAKDATLRSGELSIYTWRDHQAACEELVKAVSAQLVPSWTLPPEDFAKLR